MAGEGAYCLVAVVGILRGIANRMEALALKERKIDGLLEFAVINSQGNLLMGNLQQTAENRRS